MGIPYVNAPFEAESQCAYLELMGLVDGVITEDSDALLFGSKKVYRNIFEKNKFVEMYDANIIQKDMGLNRRDLIKMAMFMGSDYTKGVKGIAAVNATEIINSFPDSITQQGQENEDQNFGEGLRRFMGWVDTFNLLDFDKKNKQKTKKERELEAIEEALEESSDQESILNEEEPETLLQTQQQKIEENYKKDHEKLRRHWEFPSEFPNPEVYDAYLNPRVDDSKQSFTWSTPAFDQLEVFARRQLGWGEV